MLKARLAIIVLLLLGCVWSDAVPRGGTLKPDPLACRVCPAVLEQIQLITKRNHRTGGIWPALLGALDTTCDNYELFTRYRGIPWLDIQAGCKHIVTEFREPVQRIFITKAPDGSHPLGLGALSPLLDLICHNIVCLNVEPTDREAPRAEL